MEHVPGENDGLWHRERRPKPFEHRSTEERLRVVWGETWVDTPGTRKLRELIHGGLREPPKGAQGAFVVGGASAGTSGFLQKLAEEHRRLHDRRIALAAMPATVECNDLLVALRKAIGRAPYGRERSDQLETRLYEYLGRTDVVAFAVDMTEHLLHVTSARRRLMLDLLRHVGRTAGLHLLLAMPPGLLREADVAYNDPAQRSPPPDVLRSRAPFQVHRLGPFRIDREYLDLLDAWERSLPLKKASNLTGRRMAIHLYALCDGVHGRLASVLRRAAAEAITSGRERITIGLLDGMGFGPPASFSGFQF